MLNILKGADIGAANEMVRNRRTDDTFWGKILTPTVVIPLVSAAFVVGMYYARLDQRVGNLEAQVQHIDNVLMRVSDKIFREDNSH